MRTSSPSASFCLRIPTTSAVSRSRSQMKYCRWMKRRASAMSSLRRANLSWPLTYSSIDVAGRIDETSWAEMALAMCSAGVPAHSLWKRAEAAALRR